MLTNNPLDPSKLQETQEKPAQQLVIPKFGMAEGGDVSQTKRMLEDGGMLQEGGTVDEASGNKVPVGAMKEEVRDDIPAQLSEGEFVFPADVVRYIGLERLMQMRQAAKAGLKQMEEMGQMSNGEEGSEEEDTAEFESELDEIMGEIGSEEEKEEEDGEEEESKKSNGMAVGGSVTSPNNTLTATDIIKEDLNRGGFTQEESNFFTGLATLMKKDKAITVRENDTVFIGIPREPGTLEVHMYTVDSPARQMDAVKKAVELIKKSGVRTIQSETDNYSVIAMLQRMGYPVNSTETEDGKYAFTMEIA